jgi:hypothetical protein
MQIDILAAARRRLESSLFEICQLVQADVFESELEAAHALAKNGWVRAAGAMAGVVIEAHLAEVAKSHQVKVGKKEPSIGDLNDGLKNADVIEIPTWRFTQTMGDLRNLCDHKKTNDPTAEQVDELIAGAERIIKTVS